MKVIFVRHAEIKKHLGELIPDNVKISSKGKKTAKRVAEYLKDENVAVVYSSPMTRCVQTAKIISKDLGTDHIIMKQFRERLGTIPKTPEEQEWLNNYMNYDFKNGRVQTLTNFVKENYEGLDLVIKENKLKETKDKEIAIVVVAHSSNLYAFNAYFNKSSLKGNCVWMQCNNGAVIKYRV